MNKLTLLLAIILAISSLAFAKTLGEIDAEIAATQKQITKSQNYEGTLQSKVDKLSKDISTANSQVKELDNLLKNNQKEIAALIKVVEHEKDEREALTKARDKLLVEKEAIEKRLADLLVNHTAQSLVLSKNEMISEGDVIKEAMFFTMRDRIKSESDQLKNTHNQKVSQIRKIDSRIRELQYNLDRLINTQNFQKEMRTEQTKLLSNLDKQKVNYLTDLNRLIDQKNKERQMLADLHIMRQKTVDQMKQTQVSQKDITRGAQIAVKQYGTSYQDASNSSYRGKKVKAPLDSSSISIIKEFGPYTDPIYNIKIHNDSITLKPNGQDSLVRNVLPGKVIFADNLKLLGKVVIVEHKDNLHTIYRNLESISPNIKVDRSLKERESIGRINSELVFEVTKDGLPINPLQLISM
ncbi:MAG: peptidoglycan DD-metalloendopeptidase family protein [Helicobacteraceae bacterium]|jgi:septal ring factor EnvC (AmiA/AmiB activator)|nr:peptidoglycan DD-metalloendopeptidase family protein [Helicobacteraceae bacterium]